MNILVDLFLIFARIGCFTFGGGYAMISLIEDACVEKKKWITHDDMMNVTVLAESTPGPIAINCATFVGYRQGGLKGAAVSNIGMVLPSFLIIFLISCFLDNFLKISWVYNAFSCIKLAVGILILDAGITMLKKMKKKALPISVMLVSAAVVLPSFLIILLLMAILKNAIKNKYVQAALRGLKPCMIGIVLATGIYMILKNCVPSNKFDTRNVIVTAVLLLLLYGSKYVLKKKISPILLIIVSAGIGIAVF